MSNIILRPYQERLITAIRHEFATNTNKVLAVASTGAGKTIMFSYIAEHAARMGNSVFIFVHKKELIRQTCKSLRECGIPHGVIAAGYPLTDTLIQVCSIQTFVRRYGKFHIPDLVVIDEAHRSISAQYMEVMDWSDSAFRLGVTATPDRADGRPFTDYYDTYVEADDVRQLIADKWLIEPTFYAPPIEGLKESLGKGKLNGGDYDQDIDAMVLDRRVITGSAIGHYQRLLPGNPPTVVFCATVQHAHNVAQQFCESGIPSAAIDGSMDDDQRTGIIENLEAGALSNLMSCNLVSEGFNLPAMVGAIMLRRIGPKSLALFMQQVGRVLRTAPGKDKALILDHVGNCDRHMKAVLSFFKEEYKIDWRPSFEGRRKIKKDESDDDLISCPKCYMWIPKTSEICQNCGHSFKKEAQGTSGAADLEEVEGELVKLDTSSLSLSSEVKKGRHKLEVTKVRGLSLEEIEPVISKRRFANK